MRLTSRLHRLLVLGPRGYGKPVDRDVWDSQYEEGYWDHLSSIHELARYATLAAYTDFLHSAADVLDVGSGRGELLRLLERYNVNKYLGIDVSAKAVALAKLSFPDAHFEVAHFDQWRTSARFDVIIFNESLYYAERPAQTLLRYANYLNEGGSLVVSIHRRGQRAFIWRDLHKRFDVLSATTIENQRAQTWDIEVLHRKPA